MAPAVVASFSILNSAAMRDCGSYECCSGYGGNDRITGGRGNDVIFGERAAIVMFGPGFGHDVVRDFSPAADVGVAAFPVPQSCRGKEPFTCRRSPSARHRLGPPSRSRSPACTARPASQRLIFHFFA